MATTVFKEYFRGYEILGELGRGNARVLKALHLQTGKQVAIKHFSFNTDEETLRRFQQESAIMKSIQHDYVVKIFDVQLDAELPYIVMELIEGGDLRGLIKEKGCLDIPSIIRLARHMTDALEVIHSNNVVHRDIKPENIMFRRLATGDLHFLLTDFGIAKVREQRDKITVTGASMLTYEYASPEQFNQSKLVSTPADFYSLGVVLYECLTGSVPFNYRQDDLLQYIHSVLSSPVPIPFHKGGRAIPPSLRVLLYGLLEKSSSGRIADPESIREMLRKAAIEDAEQTAFITKTRAAVPNHGFTELEPTLSHNRRRKKASIGKTLMFLLVGLVIFWILRAGQSFLRINAKNNTAKPGQESRRNDSVFSAVTGHQALQENNNQQPNSGQQDRYAKTDRSDPLVFTTGIETGNDYHENSVAIEDGGVSMINDIYFNDFSNIDDSIWKSENSDTEFSINNGKYVIHGSADSFTYHSSVKINMDFNKDFSISATATRMEGESSYGFGLNYCGDTDADLYYVFYISSNGYFSIRSWVKDHWNVLTDWTRSEYIRPGMEMNTLAVEKHGPNIYFLINDKAARVLPFNGGFGNYFGFRVDGAQTVAFDHLLVKGSL